MKTEMVRSHQQTAGKRWLKKIKVYDGNFLNLMLESENDPFHCEHRAKDKQFSKGVGRGGRTFLFFLSLK